MTKLKTQEQFEADFEVWWLSASLENRYDQLSSEAYARSAWHEARRLTLKEVSDALPSPPKAT